MDEQKQRIVENFRNLHHMAVSLSKLAMDEVGSKDEDLREQFESTFYGYLLGYCNASITPVPKAREMGEADSKQYD